VLKNPTCFGGSNRHQGRSTYDKLQTISLS